MPPIGLRAWQRSRSGGSVDLRLQRREELRHEHAAGGPHETLADRRDESTDLGLRLDADERAALLLGEGEATLALDEAGAAAAFHPERVAVGRRLVDDGELALICPLHRGHTDGQGGRDLAWTDGIKPLAARRGSREHRWVREQRPHAIARGLEVMATVEGHGSTGQKAEVTYRPPGETVKVEPRAP